MTTKRNVYLATLVLPFLLSACGGGSSASSNVSSLSDPSTNTSLAGPTIDNPTPAIPAPVSVTPTLSPAPSVENASFSVNRAAAINTSIGQLKVNGTYSSKTLFYRNSQQEVTEFSIDNTENIILKITPDSMTDKFELSAVYYSESGNSFTSANVNISVYADFERRTATVLPLGDSITHGYNSISYRYRLKQKTLNDSSIDIDFIGSQNRPSIFSDTQHEGFSGYRTDEILYGTYDTAPLANRLNSISIPDIALIHEGTNDMLQGYSVSHAVDHIRETIEVLRERNPNMTILLGQIVPTGNTSTNASIRELNSKLANLRNTLFRDNSPIILVDHYANFYDSDLSDGIHPNESGEEKMAQRWFEAMLPLFDGY